MHYTGKNMFSYFICNSNSFTVSLSVERRIGVCVLWLHLLPRLRLNEGNMVFVSPALAGKTQESLCNLLSLVVLLSKSWHWLSTSICFSGFQLSLGHRCNMETHICWWGQRSQISRSKVIWSQVLRWAEDVKVASLKSDGTKLGLLLQHGTLLYVHTVKSYIKVKGH